MRPLVHQGEQARNVGRVVLQVAVEGDDEVAAGVIEAGLQRDRLPIVADQLQRTQPGPVGGERVENAPRAVARAVVDQDQLEVSPARLHRRSDALDQLGQVRLLVVDRDDDRYPRARHGGGVQRGQLGGFHGHSTAKDEGYGEAGNRAEADDAGEPAGVGVAAVVTGKKQERGGEKHQRGNSLHCRAEPEAPAIGDGDAERSSAPAAESAAKDVERPVRADHHPRERDQHGYSSQKQSPGEA